MVNVQVTALLVMKQPLAGGKVIAVLRKPGRTAGMGAVMGARRVQAVRGIAGRAVHPVAAGRIAGRGMAAAGRVLRAMPERRLRRL